MPKSTLAAMTHPQDGAQINIKGTGMANNQPVIRIRRRVTFRARLPATRLVTALARPKVAINETMAVFEVTPNYASAKPERIERSMPIMPPTKRFTVTNRANWPQLSPNPRGMSVGAAANPGNNLPICI